jgi:hypothetical protein
MPKRSDHPQERREDDATPARPMETLQEDKQWLTSEIEQPRRNPARFPLAER